MIRDLLILLMVTFPSGARAEAPSLAEVQSLVSTKVCYKLKVEVTRLADQVELSPTAIDLCMELPPIEKSGECQDQMGLFWVCPLRRINPAQKYVRFWTPLYQFFGFLHEESELDAMTGIPNSSSDFYLSLRREYNVTELWSYRLTQILYSHKAELPMVFATLTLSDEASDLDFSVIAQIERKGDSVKFKGENAPFRSAQAIGVDTNGAEYGVHISAISRSFGTQSL